MDVLFNKNNLKPGDPGFVYDKVEEFEPTEDNEWDDWIFINHLGLFYFLLFFLSIILLCNIAHFLKID